MSRESRRSSGSIKTRKTIKQVILVKKLGIKSYNLRQVTHVSHQEWLDEIQYVWGLLEENQNSQCVELEDKIKNNRKHISRVAEEN